MMAVRVTTGAEFTVGRPSLLFEGDYELDLTIINTGKANYDVSLRRATVF